MRTPAIALIFAAAFAMAARADVVRLSSLDVSKARQSWGTGQKDKSMSGKPLCIAGRTFEHGFGTHADSDLAIDLQGKGRKFVAWVGVDDGAAEKKGKVKFQVLGDEGKVLWDSGPMAAGDAAKRVEVDLAGVKTVMLHVDPLGDTGFDHADWAEATLEMDGATPEAFDPLVARKPFAKPNTFYPGALWRDTDGKPIQAHSAGILKVEDVYYWYGEDKTLGDGNRRGISCYSSKDLFHWKNEGLALPKEAMPAEHREGRVVERPKVIYNPATRKYVMWMHIDGNGYSVASAGIATAEKPAGPFTFLRAMRPINDQTYRDMNLFVDDDGKAYVFYASEGNATMYVVRLNDQFTGPQEPIEQGKTWQRILAGQSREAPAPFKFRGKYYLISSGCTGWAPNPLRYAVADSIFGPWEDKGEICQGYKKEISYHSQSTYVLPAPGKPAGSFIFLGDRWMPDLADSRYIWLPFTLREDGGVRLDWRDQWDFSVFDGK